MENDLTQSQEPSVDVAERVALAKARLSEKLSELARRVETFRDKASVDRVRTAIKDHRWLAVGAAASLGFMIGMGRSRAHAPSVPGTAQKSIPRAILMEIFVSAAGVATRRFLADRRAA